MKAMNSEVSGAQTVEYKPTKVFKSVEPFVDLGDLVIEDLDPFDTEQYKASKEEFLTNLIRDNAQFLINKVWELQTERVEDAIVAKLPDPISRLPREKPIPKIKATTKWERYARMKGIGKTKKSRMIWDETTQSYKPRWGYNRANDETKDWVVEIPRQKDQFVDYIGERMEKKKERTAKNELQRLKNIRSQQAKSDDTLGLPIEDKSSEQLARQINRASNSTASVGKFTERLDKEKPPKNAGKKRNFLPNESNLSTEKSKQLEILKRMTSKKPKLDVEKAVSIHVTEEQKSRSEEKREAPRQRKRSDGGKRRRSGGSSNGKKNSAKKVRGGGKPSMKRSHGSNKVSNKRNRR